MKALITGASSGLGRDMARVLAARGYDLILVARREERLRLLASSLSVQCEIICADLQDAKACYDLYERTHTEELAVVVNNAGFGLFGLFSETDLEREMQMLDLNCRAVHILTKLFLQDFRARNQGCILNVASSAGFLAGPKMSTYYATKNYVLRLTQAIHEELRREGSAVRISALCPGPVDTEFNQVAGVRFAVPAMTSKAVAECAIQGMFLGKAVIVPGWKMKTLLTLRHLAPESLLTQINYLVQGSKRNPAAEPSPETEDGEEFSLDWEDM